MSSNPQQQYLDQFTVDGQTYHYYSLTKAAAALGDIRRLPKTLKILLENLLRFRDDITVQEADLTALIAWTTLGHAEREITFRPARVLMQDFTGVPAMVDLAAMRDAVQRLGGDAGKINPLLPVDLVIDHAVSVDDYAKPTAFNTNVALEMQRNQERYAFLRWGQKTFRHFRVVPPGTGICHQVNLEYLGKTVWQEERDGKILVYPDTLVGTDSHTTMINGLGILGWGVGGIEAEAAMLGQPISMLIPDVVGFKLTGQLAEGVNATDLVLTVTQMLRQHGVVGKFVEFYGDALARLPLADRATIGNMAPEFGATCGFFPVDDETLRYLRLTNRSEQHIKLVEHYCKAQGLWRHPGDEPVFTSTLSLDLSQVETSLAGPKRPQDKVTLANVKRAFSAFRQENRCASVPQEAAVSVTINDKTVVLNHCAVVIAAITSCTNTSNPSVMLAAGLLAKKAVEKGLIQQPWVKTSLAPGSKVVSDYLNAVGLTPYLDKLGFNLVGYGCTTCIGNSGPLLPAIADAIKQNDITVAAVLSGNRNFEGRIHPLVQTNWLASPPLVVAYALVGTMNIDWDSDPLGVDRNHQPVFLKDIWPSSHEIAAAAENVNAAMFKKEYAQVFAGDEQWQSIVVEPSQAYPWQDASTYIRQPTFFVNMKAEPEPVPDIVGAHILALLGDSVTTDHISPAGNINADSPAGRYLIAHGVTPNEFNSYGSRRGNHEVMMRGTFANVRIRNEMTPDIEGGFTRHIPTQVIEPIFDVAMRYRQHAIPLAIIAGKEYGAGSSRDWAAKGPMLLGVRVVIAESFEKIHRSNLIGMGILPLEFMPGVTRKTLQLTGNETINISGLNILKPKQSVMVIIIRPDGQHDIIATQCRIDTENELTYYQNGGILHTVIRQLI